MGWVFLAVAILIEVAATLSLRGSVDGPKAWLAAAAAGYLIAFTCLSLALREGLGLGIAYGIWTACGVALTALIGKFLFDEPLTKLMAAGIVLIGTGVLLIQLGSH
ncbi:SMR family transporter [Arthrobacter sp.]|uniref:DMT family transporter n=1 Tax=Arthrobacter sp. TaxID=1667 RepID=UPI0033990C10